VPGIISGITVLPPVGSAAQLASTRPDFCLPKACVPDL
jgi:hypothetical protein